MQQYSSVWDLIFHSGLYSLAIIGVLLVFSFISWGIIIMRMRFHKRIRLANTEFLQAYNQLRSFPELQELCRKMPDSPLREISKEVLKEASKLGPYVSYDSIHHRGALLEEAIQRAVEIQRVVEEKNLSILALASNLSPFLGLLGTVWGIMDSLWQVGRTGSAELSVVAPGIAAALVTTIAGLLVAIPASGAYNVFVARNSRNEVFYYDYGSRVLSLFKRGEMAVLEQGTAARPS